MLHTASTSHPVLFPTIALLWSSTVPAITAECTFTAILKHHQALPTSDSQIIIESIALVAPIM